jgi:hypothetical protein
MSRKYWDIIPPKTKKKPKADPIAVLPWNFEEILEKLKRGAGGTYPNTFAARSRACLHDQCSNCHGTGIGIIGPCVHMLSCPCPKCSPMMSVGTGLAPFYEGPMTYVDARGILVP